MYIAIFLGSVLIAAISQVLLKKSAMKQYKNRLLEYFNPYVICGYGILFLSMLMTVFAYRGVDMKTGPVLEATSYLYVAVLSAIFLKEKISAKKKIGLFVIIVGVVISNL
ncbi:MAG: multidrug ABC transporter [Lachnospiraceae bacterium]|nr:multidrug ABC transporter [Lachnospiraceae bacterium]